MTDKVCVICDGSDNLAKAVCCRVIICIQCVLKQERKQCSACRAEPYEVLMGGCKLDVPNTRGYTQADLDDGDDGDDNYSESKCMRCGAQMYNSDEEVCYPCRFKETCHLEKLEGIVLRHSIEVQVEYATTRKEMFDFNRGRNIGYEMGKMIMVHLSTFHKLEKESKEFFDRCELGYKLGMFSGKHKSGAMN